ncbi:MAG: hypothetical protein HRT64_08590 [Erythrobacter sp.]|nr:hypothetical protein [Erythrobacter sp.]
MQRTVTTPADLNGAALEELKAWLGISRPNEDALLMDLLGASVSLCEAFTGQLPLEQTVEETAPSLSGNSTLSSRPVRSLVSAELIAEDGSRSPLPASDYDFRIDDKNVATFTLKDNQEGRGIAVSVRAGVAADWEALPHALKQGAVRLAAYHYRDRESLGASPPPASVTALWRPWRTLRLA